MKQDRADFFKKESRNGAEIDPDVEIVREGPKISSGTNIEFTFENLEGEKLVPGKKFLFKIPKEWQGKVVRDVVLIHRKGEEGRELIQNGWDPYGAYSRVEVHEVHGGGWRQWRDPKGYDPDKFAEPRPAESPEIENLHDWIHTVGFLKADEIRVTNVGEHLIYSASRIHALRVIFYPDFEVLKNADYRERIYCFGTEFIDFKERTHLMPRYGGGSHTEGIYRNAVALNQDSLNPELYEVRDDPGEGVKRTKNMLTIDLEPGRELLFFEVAIGDAKHLAEPDPETGRRKKPGGALMWVGIEHAGESKPEWFMEGVNVPPQETLAGAPLSDKTKIRLGDKLVIKIDDDPAYVMGWRITYKEISF